MSSGAELAMIVSDDVYRSLVCRYPSLVSPDAFQRVRFQVKHTRAWAWTYLPGVASLPAGQPAGKPAARQTATAPAKIRPGRENGASRQHEDLMAGRQAEL